MSSPEKTSPPLDSQDASGSTKNPGPDLSGVPTVETGFSTRLDSPEATEAKRFHQTVPAEVRFRFEEQVEKDAYELQRKAEEAAEQRNLKEVRELIERSPVEWTPEDIAAAEYNARSQDALPEDFDAVREKREEDSQLERTEAETIKESALSEKEIDKMTEMRDQIIEKLTQLRIKQGHSAEEAAEQSHQEYLNVLRGTGDGREINDPSLAEDYILKDSIGRKIFNRVWKGGPLAKTLKIGALAGGALLLPGMAAAVGSAYLAAEGFWMTVKALEHVEINRKNHQAARKLRRQATK